MCLGIPGQIVAIHHDAALPSGVVDFGGARRDVCLAYVDGQVEVGDFVVVHVGFAISKVDADEARKTYAVLEAMNELGDLDLVREQAEALVDLNALPSGGPPPGASMAAELGS
jgi:hydrogenase expression/formation protein HypC